MNIVLVKPIWLLLYVFVAIGIYYTNFWVHRGSQIRLPFAIWRGDRFESKKNRFIVVVTISEILFWSSIALIILAMAEPQKITREKIYLKKGKDIMLVLDESPSMFTKDLGDSRFEIAKEQLIQFINLRENDSIGLITYSSDSVLRVPPTQDYANLISQIKELKLRDDGLGNATDIGMALGFALFHLSHCSGTQQFIVLVTDGINNAGLVSPLNVAKMAKERGVKIFPIGIGSTKESAPIVVQGSTGLNISGEISAKRNDSLLNEIAKITGGQFSSSSTVSILHEVFKGINNSEPSISQNRIERKQTNLARRLIWAAFACMISYFVIRKIWLEEIL